MLHDCSFKALGLPHSYELLETSMISDEIKIKSKYIITSSVNSKQGELRVVLHAVQTWETCPPMHAKTPTIVAD